MAAAAGRLGSAAPKRHAIQNALPAGGSAIRSRSPSKAGRAWENFLQHFREVREARHLRGKVVFSSFRGRTSSFLVRGAQVADAMGAAALRPRHLTPERLVTARAVVWVAAPFPDLAHEIRGQVPQILDVVQLGSQPIEEQIPACGIMDAYIVNTPSMGEAVLSQTGSSKPTFVVLHHHCNATGYRLSPERLASPRTVGYVGSPDHLDDREAIAAQARTLGLEFREFGAFELEGYRELDLGVAWTRSRPERVRYQSNVKHANFTALGIPSVLPAYESYKLADTALGGGSCLFASSVEELLAQLERLAKDRPLREAVASKTKAALDTFSLAAIARQYRAVFDKLA